jgi:hypothetical protein
MILLPTTDDARAEEEQRKMLAAGIEIIRYPRIDDSYIGLDHVLERIWNNSRANTANTIDRGRALPE